MPSSMPAMPPRSALPEEETFHIPLLLVEDDPILRRALARALTAGGYAVTCAEDGQEALELARRGAFPVVVTDMEMPRMGGRELVVALQEVDPTIECLLMGQVEDLPRILAAIDAGNVYNFFWKPLPSLDGILRAVARALERREMRLSSSYLLAELRDTREELQRLHSHLEQLDKVAALGHMTTSITQDLENPLMSLLGYAQYLRNRLDRAEGERLTPEQVDRIIAYMQEMEQGARRCYETVQGMKEYMRVHQEPPGPSDLHEVLGATLPLARQAMEAQGVCLQVRLADTLPPALANPRRLQQAILSLLLNAQEAIGNSGGTVTVTTEYAADTPGKAPRVLLRVADTGPGIAPGLLPHLFTPFFTTRSRSEHLGLGLSIARNIARSWHGDLHIESVPGSGATATLALPLCAEMVVTEEGRESPASAGRDTDDTSLAA